MKTILLMIQFFTRIPINRSLPCSKKDFKRGMYVFSIIGIIVGGGGYLIALALSSALPSLVIATIILIFINMITGAMHTDGFADFCDGFFAFKGEDKVLEIMKDSRVGAFASIGLILNLALKIFTLSYLIDNNAMISILFISLISRSALLFFAKIGKPLSSGSGALFVGNGSYVATLLNYVISLAVGLLFLSAWEIIILLSITILIVVLYNMYCMKKLGGINGDLLGACLEINEMVLLVVLCIMI